MYLLHKTPFLSLFIFSSHLSFSSFPLLLFHVIPPVAFTILHLISSLCPYFPLCLSLYLLFLILVYVPFIKLSFFSYLCFPTSLSSRFLLSSFLPFSSHLLFIPPTPVSHSFPCCLYSLFPHPISVSLYVPPSLSSSVTNLRGASQECARGDVNPDEMWVRREDPRHVKVGLGDGRCGSHARVWGGAPYRVL